MTLETLQKDMIAAMKAQNKVKKDALSAIIGNIKKTAIDEKCKDNITEELVNRVILKEKKTVQEMIDTCPADRTDTLFALRVRMAIIEEYAPKMMSDEEIKDAILTLLSEAGLEPVKDNEKKAMKIVMPYFKGKADMSMVRRIFVQTMEG